ncbi:hypothetical protein MRB53_000163 [Persea americana]|uniref:Uncharacterized protein n=1 Tax=Persea americana TaxID=3435 RepID=A0ACC2MN45_PERAE|nr:hypothetical protein MRB53_000163 [Persea americana]
MPNQLREPTCPATMWSRTRVFFPEEQSPRQPIARPELIGSSPFLSSTRCDMRRLCPLVLLISSTRVNQRPSVPFKNLIKKCSSRSFEQRNTKAVLENSSFSQSREWDFDLGF